MCEPPNSKSPFSGNKRVPNTDTASPEVQVALLTELIVQLTDHLKANANDNPSRQGLFALVSSRKGMLDYLRDTEIERYRAIIKELGLRK